MMTRSNDFTQSPAIVWSFCDWLAEVERLARPIIHNQFEMVSGDGASNSLATSLDSFDCSSRCGMLEDDAEARETAVELMQVGQEGCFCVQNSDILQVKGFGA